MLHSVIHNARRRGVLGAFLGALAPYAFWAYENGVALAGDSSLIVFVSIASTFFAILGYGIFHGGFGRTKAFPHKSTVGVDLDELAKTHQSGKFAWVRDVHNRHK